MATAMGSVEDFFEEIEPFFYGRRITYVDVGAFKGEVFKKLKASRLKLREAHLVEPNPESVAKLKLNVGNLLTDRNFHVHQVALGATAGTVRLRSALDMTKVIAKEVEHAAPSSEEENEFEARCTTLDELSNCLTESHISLLKIDVEGFETDVLRGAQGLLEGQKIDMLYIEAGMNPEGTQQCYYRDIDDILIRCGYRLFRIYEQTTEWIVDSPLLRRVNLAYMSARFAKDNPYRLTKELFQARSQLEEARAQAESLKDRVETLEERAVGLEASKQQALRDAVQQNQSLSKRCEDLRTRLETADKQLQSLQDVSNQNRSLTQRCDELGARLNSAETGRQTLQHQELQARLEHQQELDRQLAQATTEREELRQQLLRKEREHITLVEQVSSALAKVTALERAELALAKKSVDATARNQALTSELIVAAKKLEQALKVQNSAEEMGREVFQLFDELRLSERRAQSDARTANFREHRVRLRLAHRVGTVVIENARSPIGWLRMPVAMKRMYDDYRRDKAQGLLAPLQPESEQLVFRKGRLAAVTKSHWQSFTLPESQSPCELWVNPLCVTGQTTVTIEFDTPVEAIQSQLRGLAAGERTSATIPGSPLTQVTFAAGRNMRLIRTEGSSGEIRFRKVRGAPCILKLDVRSAVNPSMIAPSLPRPAQDCVAKGPVSNEKAAVGIPDFPKPVPTTPAPDEPKRMKSAIIWQAFQLVSEGQVDRGIDFAVRHARDFVRPAISLLRASQSIGNDAEWLRHVNEYIKQFGIEPLALEPKGDSLFSRLTTRPCERIERGPLISVIMPAFEAERTLEFAARSILNQTWMPLELVIVDDCSNDRTWQIIESLRGRDSRVKALRNSANVGPYVSKNLALSMATGDYITGHDADDWAHPQRLARQIQEMLKSNGRIKASMTRMLRFNETGYFGHFAKEGKTSDDGALRDAAISCMFEATYMRKHLGHWDSVRFGADSELISRAENLLGTGFVKLRQLAMLCLDAEGSLTNDPVHGVSKLHGISPTRRHYREQWTEWHQTIDAESAYMPFPHRPRKFSVPDAAAVSDSSLDQVFRDLEKLRRNVLPDVTVPTPMVLEV